MSWFRRGKRAIAPAVADAPAPRWARPLSFQLEIPPEMSGVGTADGMLEPRIGRAQAMSVPAVKRARDLIAGTLGTLPLQLLDSRRRTVPSELLDQPEDDVARSVTMTYTVEDMLLEGRSWWRVTEFDRNGYPSKIRRLEPRSVTVRQDSRVYVSRDGTPQGQAMEWVPDEQLIRIDSPNDPLLVAGARAIRSALLLDRAANRYANEPLPLGYFAPRDGMADPGSSEEIQEVLDEWEEARRTRAWGFVGAALEAKTLQWNPEQLQLSAARDHAVLEISRVAGLDPEELGVSTTSRTYANAEQRRLDLLDFTLAAYVTAIETRLSMGDVTPPGYRVRAQYAGFLRSDTLTRMQVYEIGRRVGVYNDERIAELEDIPSAKPAATMASDDSDDARNIVEMVQKVYLGVGAVITADEARQMLNAAGASLPIPAPELSPAKPPAPPAQQPVPAAPESQEPNMHQSNPSLTFDADDAMTIGFSLSDADAQFRVNAEKRTISGLAVPWGQVARSNFAKWKFAPGSLRWADEGRVKLNRDHERAYTVGKAVRLQDMPDRGLDTSFKIGRGTLGDEMLAAAEDGIYDGFSIEVDFEDGDGWLPDPTDDSVRLVYSATLRAVALTAHPAFDSARVAAVAASREELTMPDAPATPAAPPVPAAPAPAAAPDLTTFTAGLSEAIGTAVATAFAKLPEPQGRQVVPAGRAVVTREAPVYAMNGSGPSMVRDAWRARTENDADARERLGRFTRQTQDAAEQAAANLAFGPANTTNAAAVIPPGYRPDLYVTQLMQGRPLVDSVSRGTLTDATPFTLPSFTSAAAMTSAHVEGTNPISGTLTIAPKTVTPGATSGVFQLTREIVDSSNPAIDAIAMQAMQESYSQQTEAKVYAELNGANGQGGVITAGFVPSGAQVILVSGGNGDNATGTATGKDLLAKLRAQMALYPFRRFAAPNRLVLSQEGTTGFATAVGTDGRPLLPSIGAQNSSGVGNAITQGWFVDGLAAVPAWSMSGNAIGDADVLMFNSNDVWFWESSLLTFRFEERSGPANIDLALFGYSATRLLRPIGLSAIRYSTVAVL